MELKQVILVRDDLKLPKGKLAVQVGHAAVECTIKSDKKVVQEWLQSGGKKVVLKVDTLKTLLSYKGRAEDAGFKTALIKDAGHTVVEPGTITVLGIGPAEESALDGLTSELKMV